MNVAFPLLYKEEMSYFIESLTITKQKKIAKRRKLKHEISNLLSCFSNAEDRLRGAIVRLGNDPNRINPVWGTITSQQITAGQNITLSCDLLSGQYLSIELPGQQYLTLCEVKIYEGQCGGT